MSELLQNLQEYISSLENTVAEQRREIERLSAVPTPRRMGTEPHGEDFGALLPALEIYTDGSSLGNPGPGGSAFVVKGGTSKQHYVGDKVTNNQCEYDAVLEAVKYCEQIHAKEVTIYTDSNLVVQQLRGHWKINCPALRAYKDQIEFRSKAFDTLDIKHVAGHSGDPLNEKADSLAKAAAKKNIC